MLAAIRRPDGGEIDLTLTTNGSALRALAGPLAAAGLRRVTVSLDSLDDAVFGEMNGIDFPVAKVLDGIDAAIEAGLAPVKVNMVVRRGVNESSLLPMAAWARETGVILRFIEYMDVGHSNGWRLDEVVPAAEIVETIAAAWPVEPAEPAYRGEVAGRWRYVDGGGEFGVISSVTQPFCRDCTRARISAEGKLYTCLFAVDGHDLRAVLRSGASDDELPRRDRGDLAAPRRPLLRAPLGGDVDACRGSRCSRWAADRPSQRSTRSPQACPQLATSRGRPRRRSARSSWITALTVPVAGPYRRSCPKGPTGSKDPRSHQGTLRSAAGRFGRFVATPGRRLTTIAWQARARRDVIGIPVSILPSGRRSHRPRPSTRDA